MTIGTNEFEVRQIAVFSISIFVMHVQNFYFRISTALTFRTTLSNESHFQRSLSHNFIPRSYARIFDSSSVFVRTCSTASFCIFTRHYGAFTNNARPFFSLRNSITREPTKRPTFANFKLNWPPIYALTAYHTANVWISFIILTHSSSLPQERPPGIFYSQLPGKLPLSPCTMKAI